MDDLVWRLGAPMLIAFCMAACGGGGDGSTPPPSSGGSTPPGTNQPPAGAQPPEDPTFTSDFVTFPAGVPTATVVADMDNDQLVDLIVLTTDHFASGVPGSKAVHVFYQRAGGFDVLSAATATRLEQARSLAACDIDGDGKKEILVGYNGADLTVHKVSTDGTPLPPTTFAGVRAFTIECVDLDGDGNSDLVTAGKVGVDVQVLLQRGGTLTELETFTTADPSTTAFTSLRSVHAGDINGDGKPDLVFEGFDRTRNREVFVAYMQVDGGRFIRSGSAAPTPIPLDFPLDANSNQFSVNSFAIVDLFSNGMRNIVAGAGGNQPNSRIVIATYTSDGQLVSASSFPTRDIPVSLRVADIDSDGRNDIVVFHNGHDAVGVHYQNFNGSFREEQRLSTASLADQALTDQAIVIGDFDANGKRDIVLASQSALFFFFQD